MEVFALIGILVLIPILIIYSGFSWGLVVFNFYNWFILPIFPELPVITLIQAVGLMFFIGLFNKTDSKNDIKDDYTTKYSGLIKSIISPWLSLLLGYLFKIWFL